MTRLLERAGYRVDAAPDGRIAAEILSGDTFDVILSDISMPGMDGLDLLRVVREHDLDIPANESPSCASSAFALPSTISARAMPVSPRSRSCSPTETAAERDTLVELGCDLLQGYLFAKPGPAFPSVHL